MEAYGARAPEEASVDRLPIAGELGPDLLAAISGGQAVVLTGSGQPAAVLIDLDTYQEWAAASGLAP